jgi:Tfp pilus assembly protein PilO
MTTKKKLNRPGLFIALTVATLFAGGFASYLQMQNLDFYKVQVMDLKEQVRDQQGVDAQLEEINAKLTESQEKLNHLELGVPGRAYMPTLMKEIEVLGQKNVLTMTGVRPMPNKFPTPVPAEGSTPSDKAYEEQYIEVKGTGKYMNVLAFLSELEDFPKIVSVQSVTLSPRRDATEGADPSKLEITIELKAFLFPDQDARQASLSRTEGADKS